MMSISEKNLSEHGNLEKAKAYERIHHAVYFLSLGLTFLILLIFVLTPLGRIIREASRVANPFLEIQIYFLLFSLVFLAADLPLGFYSGFVVERRFGLSNHTLASWIGDEIKKALLSFLIASLLVQAFYFLMRANPAQWWWLSWLFYFGFSLFFSKILPLWIVPLFYKYSKIEKESLKERIWLLGHRYGLEIQNFFSLNLSRTTKKANAMFTGLGKTKRVVLGDTLIANFSDDEIEVILAHEIGHFVKKHLLKGILLSAGFSLVLFYGVFLFLNFQSVSFGLAPSDPLFFPALALLVWCVSVLTGPFFKAISRHHEREADRFALEETRKKEAFISAFQKLAAQNLANPEPNPWIERLLHSHPSIGKRIRFAQKY